MFQRSTTVSVAALFDSDKRTSKVVVQKNHSVGRKKVLLLPIWTLWDQQGHVSWHSKGRIALHLRKSRENWCLPQESRLANSHALQFACHFQQSSHVILGLSSGTKDAWCMMFVYMFVCIFAKINPPVHPHTKHIGGAVFNSTIGCNALSVFSLLSNFPIDLHKSNSQVSCKQGRRRWNSELNACAELRLVLSLQWKGWDEIINQTWAASKTVVEWSAY